MLDITVPVILVNKATELVIIQKLYQLGEHIFVFVHLAVNLFGCKITNSNRRALKATRKRLYFSDFKERLVHFNGTVVRKDNNMEQRFCQSCGMPLTDNVLGTNADGSKNEDYCMYCYKDGKFLQDCTMEEMIEHCAQFVNAVNEGLQKPITKEEYIGMMKTYFPQLKRWRKTLDISNDEAMNVNPALAGVKELIAQMADKLPIAYISSVDQDGFPWTKAMLKPRKREGIKTFYFTTNTFSIRVAQYKANPKASIYFCDAKGFKGMMLRGTMEVLTDAASKEMIWHDGDEQYYPGGVTDPNYCVLKFTATDGRFYSDFYPRSFVIE